MNAAENITHAGIRQLKLSFHHLGALLLPAAPCLFHYISSVPECLQANASARTLSPPSPLVVLMDRSHFYSLWLI